MTMQPCPVCKGSGHSPLGHPDGYRPQYCLECNGKGRVFEENEEFLKELDELEKEDNEK